MMGETVMDEGSRGLKQRSRLGSAKAEEEGSEGRKAGWWEEIAVMRG
jgi:hypothetical protein